MKIAKLRRAVPCAFTIVLLAQAAAAAPNVEPPPAKYMKTAAPRRMALVISNGKYTKMEALPNWEADKNSIAASLKSLGFSVTEAPNVATYEEMTELVLRPFVAKLRPGDFVVFYYSGHGFSYDGTNYLVPTEAPSHSKQSELDVHYLAEESIRSVIGSRDPSLVMVFLDACRKPPTLDDEDANLGPAKGFDQPRTSSMNLLISFATSPRNVAYATAGDPSYYTLALSEGLLKNKESYDEFRRDIRYEVQERTQGKQTPYFQESTSTRIYFQASQQELEIERRSWEAVLAEGTRRAVQRYLAKHSIGLYAASARQWLADNAEGSRLTWTQVLPQFIETAGSNTGTFFFERAPSAIAIPRTVDLQGTWTTLGGAAMNGSVSASIVPESAFVFKNTTVPLANDATKFVRLARGEPITIVSRNENSLIARVRSGGRIQEVAIPNDAPPAFNAGQVLGTLNVQSHPGAKSVTNGQDVTMWVETFGLERVQWISITTPVTADESEQNDLSLQALDAKYQLRKIGIPESKILITEGVAGTFPGVRLRLYGN